MPGMSGRPAVYDINREQSFRDGRCEIRFADVPKIAFPYEPNVFRAKLRVANTSPSALDCRPQAALRYGARRYPGQIDTMPAVIPGRETAAAEIIFQVDDEFPWHPREAPITLTFRTALSEKGIAVKCGLDYDVSDAVYYAGPSDTPYGWEHCPEIIIDDRGIPIFADYRQPLSSLFATLADGTSTVRDYSHQTGIRPEKIMSVLYYMGVILEMPHQPGRKPLLCEWNRCEYVSSDPKVLSGKWVFSKSRLPIHLLFKELAFGGTLQSFCETYSYEPTPAKAVLIFTSEQTLSSPSI